MGAFVGCGSLGLIAVFTDETKFHILFSYKHAKIEHQSFLREAKFLYPALFWLLSPVYVGTI